MPLTLEEFLALPVVRSAEPSVLEGTDLADRMVRWVHTSEVADVGPLLHGGEVLLTTGLGLVGLGDTEQRHYVREISTKGVVALVFELGRSFTHIPEAIRLEARRQGLVLVAFESVVPFVDVTEAAHRLILDRERESRAESTSLAEALYDASIANYGVTDLIALMSERSACCVGLLDPAGKFLTAQHVCTDPEDDDHPWREELVTVRGTNRGILVANGFNASTILPLGARAIALEFARSEPVQTSEPPAHAFLRDLVNGTVGTADEIRIRAELLRLRPPGPDGLFVGVALRVSDERALTQITPLALRIAERSKMAPAWVSTSSGTVFVVVTAPSFTADGSLGQLPAFVDGLAEQLRLTSRARILGGAFAPCVSDVAQLGRSLQMADEGARLASHLGLGSDILSIGELGIYRLLSRVGDDVVLREFIEQHIGPLLSHDARRGDDLLRTLETYFRVGQSKTGAAQALGIRRQSLYGRIRRIESLLGISLDDAAARTALGLALAAWRLRRSGRKARGSDGFHLPDVLQP